MVLLIAQIILGVIVFVYTDDIQKAASNVLKDLWDARDKPANKEFWDTMQTGVSTNNL